MTTPSNDQELKQECLTQIALVKYGTTPSNLSGEQLAQIAFAAVDLYQFIKQREREARLDEVTNLGNTDTSKIIHDQWCRKDGEQFRKCFQCLKEVRIAELSAQGGNDA